MSSLPFTLNRKTSLPTIKHKILSTRGYDSYAPFVKCAVCCWVNL